MQRSQRSTFSPINIVLYKITNQFENFSYVNNNRERKSRNRLLHVGNGLANDRLVISTFSNTKACKLLSHRMLIWRHCFNWSVFKLNAKCMKNWLNYRRSIAEPSRSWQCLAAEGNNSQQLGLAYRRPDVTLIDAWGDQVSISNSCSPCINDLLNKRRIIMCIH